MGIVIAHLPPHLIDNAFLPLPETVAQLHDGLG